MIIRDGDKLSNDDSYRVTLRSYCPYLRSKVDIECKEYEIFKEIIDVVKPILEREDCKERKGNSEKINGVVMSVSSS